MPAALLPRRKAAEYAGVAPCTIDRWARAGWIRRVTGPAGTKRKNRYPVEDLDKFR